jgi:AraC family transcriptional activator of tynA and feaB
MGAPMGRVARSEALSRQLIEAAMHRTVFSTDDVPEAERFAYWREAVGERLFGFSAELDRDRDASFRANVVATIGASCTHFHFRKVGCNVFRRPRDLARLGFESNLRLYCESGPGVQFALGGREFVTKAGDVLITDPTVPTATRVRANYDCNIWLFPRTLFDPHLPISKHPHGLVPLIGQGLGGMVKAYLDALAGQLNTFDDREAASLADNFCRLLAVACGAAAGEHHESIRVARLEEAKRYIDLNLADPTLTPEKVAKALKVSVRGLHLLFEPSGATFGQYVLRRRLEECRAALVNPAADRSVTDIAFAWGFGSLTTFNRTFRQAFGMAPSETRLSGGLP